MFCVARVLLGGAVLCLLARLSVVEMILIPNYAYHALLNEKTENKGVEKKEKFSLRVDVVIFI